jgi:glycosyltransferase involved in cell wall biosynthesis
MNIGYIVDTYRAVYKFRIDILKRRVGHENVFVAEWFKSSQIYPWDNELKDKVKGDCCSFTNKSKRYETQFLNPIRIILKTTQFLKRNKINVCFILGYWPLPPLSVLIACLINRTPCILVNDSHRLSAKASAAGHVIKKLIVKQFNAAVVGGPSQVSHYEDLGIPKGRVFYGFDIIDNEYFSLHAQAARMNEDETRKRLGLPDKYFLNVGRIVKKKNLSAIVKAFWLAKKSGHFDAKLVFVGTGECEEDLKNHASSLGFVTYDNSNESNKNTGCDIYFYRNQASNDLPFFYALAKAFVLPSQREEWGLVVNEAMACSLPVIVSSVCGCAPDLVHHGINGFQFDYDNPEELAKRLIEIDSQPGLARKMGQASLEIISKWDANFFLKNVEQAIEAVRSER